MKRTALVFALMFVAAIGRGQSDPSTHLPRVHLIYSSDLYFPPDDPDDYVDLATLFRTPEIDVLGIILDQQRYNTHPESEGTGAVPLKQMFAMTGRTVEYHIGLRTPLRSLDDKGLDQVSESQQGVEMILRILRDSREKVVLLTVGTARDIAAAFHRDPGLLRRKVARIYLNAGIFGSPPGRFDINLEKDRRAFVAILRSGLPIYWAPSFGEEEYETYWQADQRKLLEGAHTPLQKYFLYAFSKGRGILGDTTGRRIADPLAFLQDSLNKSEMGKVYAMTRNMWSTASFLDAAGLRIYRNEQGSYLASRKPVGKFSHEVMPYSFRKMKISVDDQGHVDPREPGKTEVHVFHKDHPQEYRDALESVLIERFR